MKSILASAGIGPGDEDQTERESIESNLFRCDNCSEVFIAAEKSTCGRCGTTVEQVRSNLKRGKTV